MADAKQIDPFETLEHPAHGRAIRWLLHLIGKGLASGCQLVAEAMLRQPVDQQAQHHHQAEGDDALRFPRKMIALLEGPHATAGESDTV